MPIDPETGEEIILTDPEPTIPPQATSDYFKISRAIGGDDWWSQRLEMAFELSGIEDTRTSRLAITKAVVEFIDCTEQGAVNTSRVSDEMIDIAIDALVAQSQ